MAITVREQITDEIDAFLERTGLTPTTLGRLAVNDLSFVQRLRDGADIRASTIDRLRAFMANYEAKSAKRPLHKKPKSQGAPAAA